MNILDTLQRLRRQPPAEPAGPGWPPLVWLLYLGFLFMPFTWREPGRIWLLATLLSLPLFLVLYLRAAGTGRNPSLPQVLAIALLCFALQPFNPFANTYLTYAAALAPFALPGLLRPLVLTAALLGVLAIEVLLLRQPPLIIAISVLICSVCCIGNAFAREKRSNGYRGGRQLR